MEIARKLKEAGQAMGLVIAQEDLTGFLSNPESAQELNSLVEDIRFALMDYQVCTSERLALSYLISALDFITARDLQ